jgi:hypothetical protein
MVKEVLQIVCLAACLTPAWAPAGATTSSEFSSIPQLSTVFVAGPGTVVSVHRLDVPFTEPRYVIKYKTEDGELIEIWHPGKVAPVLEGMHGMLTYSTHPEMVLGFRIVTQTQAK